MRRLLRLDGTPVVATPSSRTLHLRRRSMRAVDDEAADNTSDSADEPATSDSDAPEGEIAAGLRVAADHWQDEGVEPTQLRRRICKNCGQPGTTQRLAHVAQARLRVPLLPLRAVASAKQTRLEGLPRDGV